MTQSCTSTGVKTVDAVISSSRCKLMSVHATNASGSAFTVSVYDSGAATTSGKVEVARLYLASNGSLEYDMHGRICAEGLYVDFTGAGSYSVEYA